MTAIGPSLMCADMSRLKEEVISLDKAGVDYFHLDIMDGHFVPNFTLGPDVIHQIRKLTDKPFDIHLMVQDPGRYIELFKSAGADMISIHAEADPHLQKTLQLIRSSGLKAGVALNPSTPIDQIEYVLDVVDYITIMTVNPGFAGQKFIPMMYRKIKQIAELVQKEGYQIQIQVDGNIGYDTIPGVLENGADMLVCGTSSLFKSNISREEAMQQLSVFIDGLKEGSA
ncbi:ribulose-phosphate 3-epimerase [Jeotgalibacillus malaysiensis]|uniref:ribulose-phosphate 3-epimerase n=1 Tax=Jeotgalibacillus malaysiensis TaxID=1508404 RepID=UPI00384AB1FE